MNRPGRRRSQPGHRQLSATIKGDDPIQPHGAEQARAGYVLEVPAGAQCISDAERWMQRMVTQARVAVYGTFLLLMIMYACAMSVALFICMHVDSCQSDPLFEHKYFLGDPQKRQRRFSSGFIKRLLRGVLSPITLWPS
jgi:hypothetical protein